MRFSVFLTALLVLAGPALANGFERVADRDRFLGLVDGRDLKRFGITLTVSGSGEIAGRAFGQEVSGRWGWSDGYFCRDLFLSDSPLDIGNCQTVEVRGDILRFTSDRGQGDFADLRLR
jgi:hypothetical protein